MITPNKKNKLADRMKELKIFDDDLEEKFVLGSGKGGQKVNKTSSCVVLKHIPTGIVIKCQKERSREINRYAAKKELCERIEEKELGIKSARQKAFEKIRRQKRKRSKRAKEKMLADKAHQSTKKENRKNINPKDL
jgi:peptide chain release factor